MCKNFNALEGPTCCSRILHDRCDTNEFASNERVDVLLFHPAVLAGWNNERPAERRRRMHVRLTIVATGCGGAYYLGSFREEHFREASSRFVAKCPLRSTKSIGSNESALVLIPFLNFNQAPRQLLSAARHPRANVVGACRSIRIFRPRGQINSRLSASFSISNALALRHARIYRISRAIKSRLMSARLRFSPRDEKKFSQRHCGARRTIS